MVPSFIADYEGLATASWTSGTTGNIGSASSSSWNCYYYHVVRSDSRTAYSVIMPPVRWSIAAPSSDGGNYDFWVDRTPKVGYYPQGNGQLGSGNVGITDTLLPTGHFAEYQEGFAELASFPFPPLCTTTNGTTWLQANLEAISSGTQIWQGGWTIAAIRHRVNGSAVGTLQTNPPGNRSVTTDWRFDTAKGDTYEIDIWYRFSIPAASFFATVKACGFIPTTKVSNGSRRVLSTIDFTPVAVFQNVDFSPSFNYQEQTYEVTVSGHTGWTVKDGSNGPHKIIDGGGWTAAIGNVIIWQPVSKNGYCNGIVIRFARELPQIEFYPGPLHSAWGGSIAATSPLIFRPAASGYRTYTNSTDYSTLGHIDAGTYTQSGTTVFSLVQLITDATPNVTGGGFNDPSIPEAFEFGASVGILNADVPTSITISRVSR